MQNRNFAQIAVGVTLLILYGSLYPFQFHSNSPSDPFGALLATWRTSTGRGDLLANLLLYFPLGLFLFPVFERLSKFARFAGVAGVGLALSAGVELAQLYEVGHDSAMADLYADTAGTLLGAAASALLYSKRRVPLPAPLFAMDRRPFVILLLCSWIGYRLAPFAPTIDLHKYWDALKPLVISPVLPPLDLFRHIVVVLVAATAFEALFGVVRSRLAALALVVAMLAARVLIADIVLSPAEVVGGVLGVAAWYMLLSRWRHRTQLVAALFAGVVVLQALDPFQFTLPARPFGWVPFQGFLQGSVEVNIRSLFEKMFTYGALVWLTIRAGISFTAATGVSAGMVFGLRLVQTLLPGRSAEITDAILVLIMAAALKLMREDPARDSTAEDGKGWLDAVLSRLYGSLTRSDPTQPVDLIFVLAGRMERKRYGLELFQAALAPRLLLSVERFEVSRMHTLGLAGIGRLVALRDQTPPDERNFLVEMDSTGVRVEKWWLPRCSTYGEALALRTHLARRQVLRVMVISTDVHLRRVALVFDRIFRDAPIEFLYCPVPPRFGFLQENKWWKRPDDRRFVLKEFIKLAGYRVILTTPAWAVRRFMRVTDPAR